MKPKIVIWVLALLFFGVLVVLHLLNRSTQADVVQYVFSGRQIYDNVAFSTNVTAQLLHRRENAFEGDKFSGYASDVPIHLSADQTGQIRDLVLAPSSYNFRVAPSCLPDYGVSFAFNSKTQTVRVAICFKCDQLDVFIGNDTNREGIGGGYIRPSHNQFVRVAKSIFTNAPEIQDLGHVN